MFYGNMFADSGIVIAAHATIGMKIHIIWSGSSVHHGQPNPARISLTCPVLHSNSVIKWNCKHNHIAFVVVVVFFQEP